MSQYKKDDVKEKINSTALKVFSRKGYESATISDISKESKVSVGNMYKYYKSKEEIFYSVVPESFVEEFKQLVKDKILAWKIKANRLENSILMNEGLTTLIANNKERIIILFGGCKNTKYENLRKELISSLLILVMDNYEIQDIEESERGNEKLLLKIIYENLINMFSNALSRVENIDALSKLLSNIIKYHNLGITGIIKNSK